MRLFNCPNCQHVLYFENTICTHCQERVGYHFEQSQFKSVNGEYGLCSNHENLDCNWFTEGEGHLCKSCGLTNQTPERSNQGLRNKVKLLEMAKRRLIYQLHQLKLPLENKQSNPNGLEFAFLENTNESGAVTGHSNGTITILLSEADSVQREQIRKQLSEPYRTLLGHFRHEIGHYYWEILVSEEEMPNYRKSFGDERADYGIALEKYYETGAPSNWNDFFISRYASAHPWEDWAETWAHYLHLTDTLETAHYFGLSLNPKITNSKVLDVKECPNPYKDTSFQQIYEAGVALTTTTNSLNRAMGIPDIYPFVIPATVYEKLHFIHQLIKK